MICSETLVPKLEELIDDVLHLNINRDDDLSMRSSNTLVMIIKDTFVFTFTLLKFLEIQVSKQFYSVLKKLNYYTLVLKLNFSYYRLNYNY